MSNPLNEALVEYLTLKDFRDGLKSYTSDPFRFGQLVDLWSENTPDLRIRKFALERMEEIVGAMTDFTEVEKLDESAGQYHEEVGQIVRKRLIAMVNKVSSSNAPEWFLAYLKKPR